LTEKFSFNCPSGEVILSAFADVPKKKESNRQTHIAVPIFMFFMI
jgi:hypothetical protein